MSGMRIGAIIAGIFGLLLLVVGIFKVFADLDARNLMVIQSPISGTLSVYTDPGVKWQGFGSEQQYSRREQYSFSSARDQGNSTDESIKTGFNDGGVGHISGVLSWEMPLNPDAIIRLHKEYGSTRAIEQQLIRPMLEKVIFGTGATMSSIESSSERRPEIPQTIDDQLQNGPYLTRVSLQNVKDPMTGQDKTVRIVSIATDEAGKPIRASESTIKKYGITLSPVTINDIVYDEAVTRQIQERQKSTQAVQLSIAAATRATQDAITTEKQGEANAAKTKWEQEAINAKEIALAQKDLQVAQLAAQTAAQTKLQLTLEGEGEAAKRRLIMEADGALDKKLNAWLTAQGYWANAFQGYQGSMVPGIMMGNGGSTNSISSAQTMLDFVGIKAAKDLALDMQASGAGRTSKK